jgi:protein-disulfide isomerase
MSRLLSLVIALLAPFIVGGWLITHGGLSAAAETKMASESVIPDMMVGNADANVIVIEYASFTCPHCASFHAGPYKKLKKDYIDTGKIKFVFREVYFDKVGVWSSLIARCGGQERFFGIADLIFKGQKEWARAGSDVAVANELRKIGRLAGLDDDTLESCLTDSDKITALVGWFKENTSRDDISSTPTLLINGEKYANMSYEDLVEIIDAQLAK